MILAVMRVNMNIIDLLISPLEHAFMLRALLAAVMIGTVCAVVGAYVILRGMAFFGDAIAHSILPGIAVGYLLGEGARQPLFWGAMIAAIISSLGISAISRNTDVKEDTAIGIIFAGMFALGIALISSVRNYSIDLTHFLFGDVLGVGVSDLTMIGIFGGLILLFVLAFYKEFLVLSFDPILAGTLRLPARTLDNLLIILIAVAIVISIQTVGVALMVAMLVTPAATAFLLTRRLPFMMGMAALIASMSSVVGLYLSYYLGIASGAGIVLTTTLIFALVWMIKSVMRYLDSYRRYFHKMAKPYD